ncbi:MAG TPA: hypothetical protein VMV76_04285 [Dehalococcoidia bacterium]|nr:hypothetical protein [Dehalococcoidia bacterium]
MTINIHTNISNANHIEIEKNSDDHITVWITHDGELHGIWLQDISPDFEIDLNGVQVGKQARARRYLFSHKTRDKAITLLKNGAFTRKQIASFLGLKDSSVYTLITDIRQEHTIERSGKWGNQRYTIAS